MEHKLQNIQGLILRSILGQATDEELKELEEWCDAEPSNRQLYEEIVAPHNIQKKLTDYADIDVTEAFERNQRQLRQRTVRRLSLRLLPYAAAVAIILTAVLFLPDKTERITVATEAIPAIPAGTKKAELILGSGEKVQLVAGLNTTLKEGSANVKITGDKIDYEGDKNTDAVVYNTIRTPIGGEYTITLEDGTVVWLNAMSELKYPTTFCGDKRVVKLKGEAYFDVRKMNGKPFMVEVENYQVEVLGTTFNISSYANQPCIYTTLCTGNVMVTNQRSAQHVNLTPGEQLSCNVQTGKMEVKQIDTQMATAWINGNFVFDNSTMEEIFITLERWYGINVFYSNNSVKNEIFTGKLPRFEELGVILNIIEKVSDIRFEIKGRTIVVK